MLSDVTLPFTAFMDIENSRIYVDGLYSCDPEMCLNSLICIKNSVIGSNRRKGSVISQGLVPRLVYLLRDKNANSAIRQQAAITIGSLAKGTERHVEVLMSNDVMPALLDVLDEDDRSLADIAISCLHTLTDKYDGPNRTPFSLAHLQKLLNFAICGRDVKRQTSIASILSSACRNVEEQNALNTVGAAAVLGRLLQTSHHVVCVPVLKCLASMAYENPSVGATIVTTKCDDSSLLVKLIVSLEGRDKPVEVQLHAARCLTNLYRIGVLQSVKEVVDEINSFEKQDPIVYYRTLPCLVRLCQIEHPLAVRASAADTLSYLIEVDTHLQRMTAISNQLITSLSDLLNINDTKAKQGALRAFASLGSNDEALRKRIIETNRLMERVLECMNDPNELVKLAAVRCLHSLSRSVQLLRTIFPDHNVWQPLMAVFEGSPSIELLSVASSVLCNLLLEFSPAKEPMLQQGAIQMLANLTRRTEPVLRLNGVWGLMNLAFQSEQRIKSQILTVLGTDQLFRLLSDSDTGILMKTLGLIRNSVSPRAIADAMMAVHGSEVMKAMIFILEGPHSVDVKEQALCILANIADGVQAKDCIMENEDVLKKIIDYMGHTSSRIQTAAVCCIYNLVRLEEPGVAERQSRLRDLGVINILHQLIPTSDSLLFEKVKASISQFTDL